MSRKALAKATVAKRAKRASPSNGDDLDSYGIAAMKMFDDPCGATISESVYEGDSGYLNRFVANFTVAAGAGETAGILVIRPGVGVACNVSAVAASTGLSISFVDTQMPGAGFLNTNSTKFRCAGFCAIVTPTASPNNATGTIGCGNLPCSSLPQGGAITAEQVLFNVNEKVSASQALIAPLQVKWQPGLFDDKYCPATGVTTDDDTDRNALVLAFTGFPAGSGVQVRLVGIYEWTPFPTIGISIDSTAIKRSRCNLACVLRNLKRKSPTWWLELGKAVGRGYIEAGISGAASRAIRYM